MPIARCPVGALALLVPALAMSMSAPGGALASSRAEYVLRVCNAGNAQVSVVVVTHHDTVLSAFVSKTWSASGWWNVEPRDCTNVYTRGVAFPAFVAFVYRNSNDELVPHYAELEVNDGESGLYGIDARYFCVDFSRGFSWERETYELATCRSDEAPLAFTMYFNPRASTARNYKMTLTVRPRR